MCADQRRRAAAAEQHHLAAIAVRQQYLQHRTHFSAAAQRPDHDQIGPEFAECGPDVESDSLARDESELVKHLGEKHAHMRLVLDDAGSRRNWPPAKLNNLSSPQFTALVGHDCGPSQKFCHTAIRGPHETFIATHSSTLRV